MNFSPPNMAEGIIQVTHHSSRCIKIMARFRASKWFLYGKFMILISINKYKSEVEERLERMRRQEEEAKIPQGTRLMGEEERIQTLGDL